MADFSFDNYYTIIFSGNNYNPVLGNNSKCIYNIPTWLRLSLFILVLYVVGNSILSDILP